MFPQVGGDLGPQASSAQLPEMPKSDLSVFKPVARNSSPSEQECISASPSNFSGSPSSLAVSTPPSSGDDAYPTSSGASNSYPCIYEGMNLVDEHYTRFMTEISNQKPVFQLSQETENFSSSLATEPGHRYMNHQNGLSTPRSYSSFFNSIPTQENPIFENSSFLQHRHLTMGNDTSTRVMKNLSSMV